MNVIALIPARLASTRFPNKPLANILGKSMLQHIVERV
ncbi:MAG: cytidylyltransferase domain-containing protein, partial [Acidimicrobiaceae bacterium]